MHLLSKRIHHHVHKSPLSEHTSGILRISQPKETESQVLYFVQSLSNVDLKITILSKKKKSKVITFVCLQELQKELGQDMICILETWVRPHTDYTYFRQAFQKYVEN
jgi:hypothetical protein